MDLVYGYGGVKLFPRKLTIDMDTTNADMTTSISQYFIAMPEVANITAFNTDAFSTWRSAFRECAKLSSKAMRGKTMKKQKIDLISGVQKAVRDAVVISLLLVLLLGGSLGYLIWLILAL